MAPLQFSHLLLVARFPSPGKCKTRLIPRLGAEGASVFALAALSDLLHLFAGLPVRKTLLFTPDEERPALMRFLQEEGLSSTWNIHPQIAGVELGARLSGGLEYIQRLSDDHQASVTFIGMDCFDLTPDRVRSSIASVTPSKAHILPARDGGYVLLSIPLRRSGNVFDEIPWSSDQTGDVQVKTLTANGIACEVGDTLDDVDEPEDLDRLWRTQDQESTLYPRTMKFLASIFGHEVR